jgi:hypothetical protein
MTQKEVDALWPDKYNYSMKAVVIVAGANDCCEAATKIQPLYDHGMAGEFNVDHANGDHTFDVSFTRAVTDDAEVVNERLLNGEPLNETLRNQLLAEIDDGKNIIELKVLSLGDPTFH